MHDAPPEKAQWRSVRHFGDGIDRLGMFEEADRPGGQ
jgi:hypothetical protein